MSGRGRGTPTTSPTRRNRRASSWASSHSGGSGHGTPARWARRQYSDTVPRPTPQARAMARWARRCSYFSRRISRTCLINSLSVMSGGALLPRGPPYRVGPGYRRAITVGIGDHDPRNRRSRCAGIGDQDQTEWVIRMDRNRRSGCVGIRNIGREGQAKYRDGSETYEMSDLNAFLRLMWHWDAKFIDDV